MGTATITLLCTHVAQHFDDAGKVVRESVSLFDAKTEQNACVNITVPALFGTFAQGKSYSLAVGVVEGG